MQVRYLDSDPLAHDTPLLAVGVVEGARVSEGLLERIDQILHKHVTKVVSSRDMRGREKDEVVLYGGEAGPARFVLLGLGPADEVDAEKVRRFLGRAVRAAERLGVASFSASLDTGAEIDAATSAQAAAEGAVLAAWRYRELKHDAEDESPPEVSSVDIFGTGDAERCAEAARVGAVLADAENLARTLQERPGNRATPSHIAEEARRSGAEVGLEVDVFDEARLRAEGMHAILAVSAGSEEEARLIVMKHAGGKDGDPPLVLVGKGLTFDAGGISIKPAEGMQDMKFDMSGGAAVIAAMQAVAALQVPLNVVGIVPSSENLPSGTAVKPGDVIDSYAGKTIEVINTDAEGRLILADALAYGAGMGPAAMVDCATLTGSVVIALGHHAAGVLGTDDALVEELRAAGMRSGERCWPLPLWPEYRKQLDSETADLQNVGGRPAGTITAACFLREFVGDVPWAHLDIAGTAYGEGDLPYRRKGGHGFPTRLLVEWVRGRAG